MTVRPDPERMQGGNPAIVNGLLVFNGSMDGNRQVDPQIAVGGNYVLHGTNSGLIIYNKKGEFNSGRFSEMLQQRHRSKDVL